MALRQTTAVRAALATGAIAMTAAALPASANAAFPGQDGSIAFDADGPVFGAIYAVEPDGSGERRLTPGLCDSDASPDYSPNGNKILFTRHYSSEQYPDGSCSDEGPEGSHDIWVMRSDGTGARRITDHPASDYTPAWSPSGRRIVFASDRDGDDELFSVRRDGTDRRKLTDNRVDDSSPAWSTEGLIAFVRGGSVYSMRAGGTRVRRLHRGYWPDFSPGGRRIAFTFVDIEGDTEIYRMRADGTDRRRIFSGPHYASDLPAWSPEGGRIAFTGPSGGLYTVRADGDNPVRLNSAGVYPSWQPR